MSGHDRDEPLISIGELAARTNVPGSTLRSWEQRLGFPEPVRTAGGQRRYRPSDVELVTRVMAERERGLSLTAAVGAVLDAPQVGVGSLFAQLRSRFPHLDVLSFGPDVMRSLSHAIEDECLAHASRPLLFGSFQDLRGYRRASRRWRVLARSAAAAVAFADFPETDPDATPVRVALTAERPMNNEWSVVCLDAELTVTLVAWERPRGNPTAPRRFEALLSLEPDVVHHAARLCAVTAEDAGVPGLVDLVGQRSARGGEDAARTASLLRRFATYADR